MAQYFKGWVGGWVGGVARPPPVVPSCQKAPCPPSPPSISAPPTKQDKSSRGSVDTTKTRSDPQRVGLCSGERPMGAAKGKQSDTEALCQATPHHHHHPFLPPSLRFSPPPPSLPPMRDLCTSPAAAPPHRFPGPCRRSRRSRTAPDGSSSPTGKARASTPNGRRWQRRWSTGFGRFRNASLGIRRAHRHRERTALTSSSRRSVGCFRRTALRSTSGRCRVRRDREKGVGGQVWCGRFASRCRGCATPYQTARGCTPRHNGSKNCRSD